MCTFHGPAREALAGRLEQFDVVLASYDTVRAEFAAASRLLGPAPPAPARQKPAKPADPVRPPSRAFLAHEPPPAGDSRVACGQAYIRVCGRPKRASRSSSTRRLDEPERQHSPQGKDVGPLASILTKNI